MLKHTFKNPLLPGFYPDPSICRVGEDYYMVTSSFVYYPGLPIFHSKDLVHWEQIGHGIHRPDQLDYKNCETSLGLWAPSIRYHEGTFYIINTFVSEGREARRDNYIITATNPVPGVTLFLWRAQMALIPVCFLMMTVLSGMLEISSVRKSCMRVTMAFISTNWTR